MAIEVKTLYPGEVYGKILAKVSVGNEVVQNGVVHLVEPEDLVGGKYIIPRIRVKGSVLQTRKETPVTANSKGDIEVDEKALEPKDFMVYIEFNPRIFERFWKPWQSSAKIVFSELDEEIQMKVMEVLHNQIATEIGEHLLVGVKSPNPDKPKEGQYFDGLVSRARDSANTLKIVNAVILGKSNILDAYAAVKKAIPKAYRSRKDLVILCSYDAFDYYDEAITEAKQSTAYDEEFKRKYKGIKLVPMANMPDNVLLCSYASIREDSNFWVGLTYDNTSEPILIDRTTNASEVYFLKMLMKADTNLAWDEHCVLYDGK